MTTNTTTKPIRILKPSLDDSPSGFILRGVIDNGSLGSLKTDFYQRELLPSVSRKRILDALVANQSLPDVVLGMRGERFDLDDEDVLLYDPVFIIDGQQRCRTVETYLAEDTDRMARLGAAVHFCTNAAWERDLFQKLNQYQVKVSSNILLRNTKEDHDAVATLYGLTTSDTAFPLYDRVSWAHGMRRSDLISAVTMLHVVVRLHTHISAGLASGLSDIIEASDALIGKIGLPLFRQNVKTFFELIEKCWGIRNIHIKGNAAYMKRGFLQTFVRLLSDHPVFWKDDRRLDIDTSWRRKLATFAVGDPEVMRLAGASGAAQTTLYMHVLNHLNSGKRTHRLVSRHSVIILDASHDDISELEEVG